MNDCALSSLQPGIQLGNLEYRIDDADLSAYRELVGSGGHYPNLLNDDCRGLLTPYCGPTPLTAVWRRWEFLRPPIPGRRLQVGGWLRTMERRDGIPYFRVAAFTVDEIGTEILRAEAVFRQGPAPTAYAAGRLTPPAGCAVPSGLQLPGDAESLPGITLPDGAAGPPDRTVVIAGWLESAMGVRFGADLRWGGRLALAYRGCIAPGEIIAGDAVTLAADAIPGGGGAVRYRIALSAVNQAGLAAAIGDAEITAPSPRRV